MQIMPALLSIKLTKTIYFFCFKNTLFCPVCQETDWGLQALAGMEDQGREAAGGGLP